MDPQFVAQLKERFKDPRVTIIQDMAQNLPKHLDEHGFKKADIIVSIVPLNLHPQAQGIFKTVQQCLKKGGRYVQVAFVPKRLFEEHFTYVKQEFTLLNFPPEKVHFCLNDKASDS